MAIEKNNELVITRVFNAPIEKVWQAWSDPKILSKWWGPAGFTAPHMKIDFKVGGKYHFCMRGAGMDGVMRDFWSCGKYLEIEPMKKIVATDSFADEMGNVVPASYYGMGEGFPLEFKVILNFTEKNQKTTMILKHIAMPKGEMQDLSSMGWNSSFDKLDAIL